MTEVISVRFRGGCKNYDFDPRDLTVHLGDSVVVETSQGLEFGVCTAGRHEVEDSAVVAPLCPVVRLATDADRRTAEYNKKRESEAFDICEKKIADHGLEMKLVNVSCSFDASKIIFFFTADGRVDFRELVRDLAGVFRARIELRQIGVRDEAKMIGGLGICGRPFCCSQFLDGFLPVSIKMAKTQNLSLNPAKISGTCGRLMCCLKYEQNAYEDAAKRMPKVESFVQTPDGPGNVKSVDLLREQAKVSLDGSADPPKCYHGCELCVLRNGKGSREGIVVPAERPERFIEEKPPEETMNAVISPFRPLDFNFPEPQERPAPARDTPTEDAPARRRRSRGRRGGPKPEGAKTEGAKTEGGKPEEGRSANSRGADGAAGKRPARPARPAAPKTRPPQKGEGAPRPPRTERPQAERPRMERPQAERPQTERPQAAQTPSGEDARPHRPHHRGGRRHRGGGGGAAPTGE